MPERFRREDRLRGYRSGEYRGEPEREFRGEGERYRGYGARPGPYSPRSAYERDDFGYSAEPGEARTAGERAFGQFEGPYGIGHEYERDLSRTPGAAYGQPPARGYPLGPERDYGRQRGSAFGWGGGEEERGWWDRATDEVRSWFGDEEAERRRTRESMRGRGPKGYARPDERIREDVCDELTEDPTLDASDIEVKVANGEVTLSGTVEDREDKRHAEDVAESILGVKDVQNNLRIDQTTLGGARETGVREPERA